MRLHRYEKRDLAKLTSQPLIFDSRKETICVTRCWIFQKAKATTILLYIMCAFLKTRASHRDLFQGIRPDPTGTSLYVVRIVLIVLNICYSGDFRFAPRWRDHARLSTVNPHESRLCATKIVYGYIGLHESAWPTTLVNPRKFAAVTPPPLWILLLSPSAVTYRNLPVRNKSPEKPMHIRNVNKVG